MDKNVCVIVERYRVQSDEFAYMSQMLNELVQRVANYFRAGAGSDFKMSYDGTQLPLGDHFSAIDRHFRVSHLPPSLSDPLTPSLPLGDHFSAIDRHFRVSHFRDDVRLGL